MPSTTITTSTTTTIHKAALPPQIYNSRNSKIRNMSYDYTEPQPDNKCDSVFCGFFGWIYRIIS
jgi:hypothetical protein